MHELIHLLLFAFLFSSGHRRGDSHSAAPIIIDTVAIPVDETVDIRAFAVGLLRMLFDSSAIRSIVEPVTVLIPECGTMHRSSRVGLRRATH
jgi:hypothetical protein